MNTTTQFLHKSSRLGVPIAGVTVHIHRTCWLLLAVLVLAPSGAAVFLTAVTGSLLLQVAAYGVAVRYVGGTPQDAIVFPFGPVFTGAIRPGPMGRQWVALLAGTVCCLLVGALLATIPRPVACAEIGRLSRNWGLLSLLPCYPLAGGVILRETLMQGGASPAIADDKALEVSRVCILVIGCLALLTVNLALLYAVLVLWVISHLSLLVSPVDLDGVMVNSRAWLKNLLSRVKQARKRILAMFVWLIVPGICLAAGPSILPGSELPTGAAFTPPPVATAVDADGLAQLEARLAKLETSTRLHNALAQRTADDLTELERNMGKSQREWTAHASEFFAAEQRLTTGQGMLWSRMGKVDAGLADLDRRLKSCEKMAQRDTTFESWVSRALATSGAEQPPMMQLVILANAVVLVFLAWFVVYYEKRLRRIESRSYSDEKTPPANSDRGANRGVGGSNPPPVTAAHPAICSSPVTAARALPEHRPKDISAGESIPEPGQLLQRLIQAFGRSTRTTAKPSRPAEVPWNIGVASIKGPVRDHNEDYALAFAIAGHKVLVVADGVGGLPLGQRAGYLAVRAAAVHIIGQFQRVGPRNEWKPEVLAAGALGCASARLAAAANGSTGSRDGLRTTLIVVVASPRTVAYCYIGDGAGCLVRASGQVEQFLVPQKADPALPNLLAASLGPTMQGKPMAGSLPRLPGDLLICGTDGVFDRLNDDYPQRFQQAAHRQRGNLQHVADQIVHEMSVAQDELGFISDDNLTIALLGNSIPPFVGGEEVVPLSSLAEQPTDRQPPARVLTMGWTQNVFSTLNRGWSFLHAPSPCRAPLRWMASAQNSHPCPLSIDRNKQTTGEES